MKTTHTIEDIEFTGKASCGTLYYVADGEEVEITGEFYMDKEGNIHHEHWFDDDGDDKMDIVVSLYTYDVVFNNECDSNSKGMKATIEYCREYIRQNNGTNESYFADYKGGMVSIVRNETGETIYEEEVR